MNNKIDLVAESERINNRMIRRFGDKRYYVEMHDFIWLKFEPNKPLFPELTSVEMARCIRLAAELKYTEVVFKTNDNGMKQIHRILNLTPSKAYVFLNKLEETNILVRKKDGLVFNPDYFCKGKLDKDPSEYRREGKSLVQISVCNIKTAYEEWEEHPSKLSTLGKVIKLAPYLNVYHSIVCHNIFELLYTKLDVLSMDEADALTSNPTERDFNFAKQVDEARYLLGGILDERMINVETVSDPECERTQLHIDYPIMNALSIVPK